MLFCNYCISRIEGDQFTLRYVLVVTRLRIPQLFISIEIESILVQDDLWRVRHTEGISRY